MPVSGHYRENVIGLISAGSATGLDPQYAETLQIVSYSIGGHYEPHVDYFNTYQHDQPMIDQDRMATFLFYLNDVKAGGATVFPLLGLSVPPRAGSALYWENLDVRGVGHQVTLHAGCPVLAGHKNIANLWFFYAGQLLTCPPGGD